MTPKSWACPIHLKVHNIFQIQAESTLFSMFTIHCCYTLLLLDNQELLRNNVRYRIIWWKEHLPTADITGFTSAHFHPCYKNEACNPSPSQSNSFSLWQWTYLNNVTCMLRQSCTFFSVWRTTFKHCDWPVYLVPASSALLHLKGKYLTDGFNLTKSPLQDYTRCSQPLF